MRYIKLVDNHISTKTADKLESIIRNWLIDSDLDPEVEAELTSIACSLRSHLQHVVQEAQNEQPDTSWMD